LLRAVSPDDGARLHLVAPPGAGKTLIGLALAVANGRPALVLTPTTVIRQQWVDQARTCFRTAAGAAPTVADAVAPDAAPDDFTAVTYQSLSVVDSAAPWQEAARTRWVEELTATGQTPQQAETWLADLAASNPAAYLSGISRRASSIRATVASLDVDHLAALLHPQARSRLDALVEARVGTIIVDECHHLRTHWAAVVHYLLARLDAVGARPTLIGLTATLPSVEDRSRSRYYALLGDVDYEIPIPAVVRAGCLAPSRNLVRFTLPDPEEQNFLAAAGAELGHRIDELLLSPDGIQFLLDMLAPEPGPDELAASLTARLVAGFDADPQAATAAAALLQQRLGAYTPTVLTTTLVPLLPPARILDIDELLDLLGRYALGRLLPDPARRQQWEGVKELLAGYGYHLTDAGLRVGRSPQDTVCAASRAKDVAAVEILRTEQAALGERLRAVVVTDAADRSATHRALNVLTDPGAPSAQAQGGALRCYATMLADAVVRDLHPVLLTGRHLQLASPDAALLADLREATGLALPAHDDGWVLRVRGPETGSAAVVRAVSTLVERGAVRLVVGTRGLLGEGWDCPAVNTLIDLTTVTTATSVQQLRGRTLRLDPAWPGKSAHNWSVTCLLPRQAQAGAGSDLARLERRHDYLWSAVATPADAPDDAAAPIRTGLPAALTPSQRTLLSRAAHAGADAELVTALNAATSLPPREQEARAWAVPVAAEAGSSHGAPTAAGREALTVVLTDGHALLRRGRSAAFWHGAALSTLAGLQAAGRLVPDLAEDAVLILDTPRRARASPSPAGRIR
ncbi:DEAD/DEAH box helicase family protein, partial [Actinomyces sp. MRS3W]|uniref:DEAD/DEAH box helicase family protein n=1 Tax=Actinomyces sp. MRS3W TaxID=2800796 RepID=UPI0028FD8904